MAFNAKRQVGLPHLDGVGNLNRILNIISEQATAGNLQTGDDHISSQDFGRIRSVGFTKPEQINTNVLCYLNVVQYPAGVAEMPQGWYYVYMVDPEYEIYTSSIQGFTKQSMYENYIVAPQNAIFINLWEWLTSTGGPNRSALNFGWHYGVLAGIDVVTGLPVIMANSKPETSVFKGIVQFNSGTDPNYTYDVYPTWDTDFTIRLNENGALSPLCSPARVVAGSTGVVKAPDGSKCHCSYTFNNVGSSTLEMDLILGETYSCP